MDFLELRCRLLPVAFNVVFKLSRIMVFTGNSIDVAVVASLYIGLLMNAIRSFAFAVGK